MSVFLDSCAEFYQKVFKDDDDTDWCALGYEGKKLKGAASGSGGLTECLASFEDTQILYCLLRLAKTDDGGDSKRVKFIFITWVGENAPALKKGQVNIHKDKVGELFKGFHIEKQIYDRDGLEGLSEELDALLKKAGGANYDLGNERSGVKAGASSSYKSQSKEFFKQKDSESEVKGAVYEKAPPTEAKKNTIGYNSSTESPKAEAPVADAPEADASTEGRNSANMASAVLPTPMMQAYLKDKFALARRQLLKKRAKFSHMMGDSTSHLLKFDIAVKLL
eukprot:gene14283-16892_t